MERRNAIKVLSLSLGSLISLPAWASSWQSATLVNASLSRSNEAIIWLQGETEATELIIWIRDWAYEKAIISVQLYK